MKTTKNTGRLFGLFLLLFIGALLWFCTTADDFYTYTTQVIEGASAVDPLHKEGMLARSQVAPLQYDTEIKYRKFFITAPGAEKVELQGDFNRWGQDPLFLTAYKKGYFETSVALTGGEYKYLFRVDGKDTLDPSNQDRQVLSDGREVCIKTVR